MAPCHQLVTCMRLSPTALLWDSILLVSKKVYSFLNPSMRSLHPRAILTKVFEFSSEVMIKAVQAFTFYRIFLYSVNVAKTFEVCWELCLGFIISNSEPFLDVLLHGVVSSRMTYLPLPHPHTSVCIRGPASVFSYPSLLVTVMALTLFMAVV